MSENFTPWGWGTQNLCAKTGFDSGAGRCVDFRKSFDYYIATPTTAKKAPFRVPFLCALKMRSRTCEGLSVKKTILRIVFSEEHNANPHSHCESSIRLLSLRPPKYNGFNTKIKIFPLT